MPTHCDKKRSFRVSALNRDNGRTRGSLIRQIAFQLPNSQATFGRWHYERLPASDLSSLSGRVVLPTPPVRCRYILQKRTRTMGSIALNLSTV
jgi:hypothetical protein